MITTTSYPISVALVCALVVCTPRSARCQTDADSGLAQFFQLRYAEALASFDRAVSVYPADSDVRAWRAEALRRLGRKEDALRAAREVLLSGNCSSLAHCVIAQAEAGAEDSVRVHARAAIACDPSDPNPWVLLWGDGMRRNDIALHDSAIVMMRATGFFTPVALAWGRALLRTLPPEAVFITAGDMDTYPALAVQITEGFRTDVTVMEQEHAGIDWTRLFYRTWKGMQFPPVDPLPAGDEDTPDAGAAAPSPHEQVIHAMLEAHRHGAFKRPITLALTLDPAFLASDREYFQLHGLSLLYRGAKTSAPDTAALRACLDAIEAEQFRGSWTGSKDRSPVRRFYTDGLAEIITELYATYAGELDRAGRTGEAEEMRRRAAVFAQATRGNQR